MRSSVWLACWYVLPALNGFWYSVDEVLTHVTFNQIIRDMLDVRTLIPLLLDSTSFKNVLLPELIFPSKQMLTFFPVVS